MKMKKYVLSLICVCIIVSGIGAAAGLWFMSSAHSKKNGSIDNPPAITEQNNDNNLTENTAQPSEPALIEPLRIKPSTKIIFEYFYQADNRSETNEKEPPYFLLDMTREKIAEYYADWDILEFGEDQVRLRRVIPNEIQEHYVLGVKDNFIAVYYKSNTGTYSSKEVTATPIGGLSQDEQNKLITGITIKTEEQLAKILEDYSS